MVKELKEEDNQEYKAKAPVLEGQDIKLPNKEGVVKDYIVAIIDEEGVHLAEWDVEKNELIGPLIIIPPEEYESTFRVPAQEPVPGGGPIQPKLL
jgi:hypothetical protein